MQKPIHSCTIEDMKVIRCGECALTVKFEERIDPLINDRVIALYHAVQEYRINGVHDMIPAYNTLTFIYDPLTVSFEELRDNILQASKKEDTSFKDTVRHIDIPVCYGGIYGEDLQEACAYTGLSEQEFIFLHCERDYRVYMIGFLPGFPYLGGLDERLYIPRKKTPRTHIPAGSVGIGGLQTGVYPLESPGGWNLIGRTPVSLFDPAKKDPVLLKSGDIIRFRSITEKEYEDIGGASCL